MFFIKDNKTGKKYGSGATWQGEYFRRTTWPTDINLLANNHFQYSYKELGISS